LALSCAHERGVVHNDIKPSNLLVRPSGQVIVTDFGIGQPVSDGMTSTNELAIGTLRYMAPERLSGPGTPKSDIYSLGVTLYELTTRSPLFDFQKRTQLNDAIIKLSPVTPRRMVPDLPGSLERIIMKAIAKQPDERYASARAMAEDLRRFINREPVKADAEGAWQRLKRWCLGWFTSRHR
jgi:serine/threonine protein kinase